MTQLQTTHHFHLTTTIEAKSQIRLCPGLT